ncbi:MAG: hypothetical protein M3Q60_10355 [Actinomycetota bacterium]|jgi:uncharacterized membrane protein|nr:hypothetical protein [Actinomycetota bacterium]
MDVRHHALLLMLVVLLVLRGTWVANFRRGHEVTVHGLLLGLSPVVGVMPGPDASSSRPED